MDNWYCGLQPKGEFHDWLLSLLLKHDLNQTQYIPFHWPHFITCIPLYVIIVRFPKAVHSDFRSLSGSLPSWFWQRNSRLDTIWEITLYEHDSVSYYLTPCLSTCWQRNTNLAATITCNVRMTVVLFKVEDLQTFRIEKRMFKNLQFELRCVWLENVNVSILSVYCDPCKYFWPELFPVLMRLVLRSFL
jgi:hypothetical protein